MENVFFKIINEEIKCDVVIIGAGAAGIRAAIESYNNDASVVILNKGKFGKSGSTFYRIVPGWGIQLLSKGESYDTYDNFLKEIIEVGEGMASQELARILVEETPDRVVDLENMGINFYKIKEKFYKCLCCFASIERECADAFDMENIKNCFTGEIKKRNIKVIDNFNVIKIITNQSKYKKKVTGVIGINFKGNLILVKAKAVILASGGCAFIYRHNLNSYELTGDGYELALDAGASLINMEFIQFIYGIIAPKKFHFFDKVMTYNPPILNCNKEEFIRNYIPEEYTIEEIVKKRIDYGPFTSRFISKYYDIAIYSEIKKGNGTKNNAVYLDFKDFNKHLGQISKSYPTIADWYNWILEKRIISKTNHLEIDLCAHANNGGLLVKEDAMTEVDGLFACGEIMAGPHGADREGGNMMASTQVFGKIAGRNAANFSKFNIFEKIDNAEVLTDLNKKIRINKSGTLGFRQIQEDIQDAVTSELVICRNERGLKWLINKLEEEFYEKIRFLKIENNLELKNYFNLKTMINSAYIIAMASLLRKESRGSHHRSDYPEKDNKKFKKVLKIQRKNNTNIFNFINSLA